MYMFVGVIYCKPHHKELFQPKPVIKDLTEEIMNKNIDFSTVDPIGKVFVYSIFHAPCHPNGWCGIRTGNQQSTAC